MTARKTKVDPFLTSKENVALDLAFEWLGESRVNRTMEEYREIASRIPNLTELRKIVNKRLRQIAKTVKHLMRFAISRVETTATGMRNFRHLCRWKPCGKLGSSQACPN